MTSLTKITVSSLLMVGLLGLSACGESDADKAKNAAREGCEKTYNQNTAIAKEQRDQLIKECQAAIK
ncbi:MAG: hypothetical protein IPP67_06555 [Rhodospirillaceae bacterium]|nr:hypothetical protein [Rhodospirillaceae bacterium]